MSKLFVALFACAALLFAQMNNGTLEGVVSDPTGAAVPGAEVQVTNLATGQAFKTTTTERGEWVIPALPIAPYRIAATKPGFKASVSDNVEIHAGVPVSVNMKLELGQATETVEVLGGAEIGQATSAAVSSTVTGRQIFELPFPSRNAIELLITQPGTSTPTNPRSSSINGLPKGALN